MVGLHPLSSTVDKRKLAFLHKLLSLANNTLSKQLFFKRYFTFIDNRKSVTMGFIPDICNILNKYGLWNIMHSYIVNPESLPPKSTWKSTVNTIVNRYETDAWRYRTSVDPDFSRFRHLHRTIRPCALYRLYNSEINPKIIRLISKIWVVLPYEIPSTCPLCLEPITDEIEHVLSNCMELNALKTTYISNIMMYVDRNIANELSSDPPNIFTLKVLGSEINSDTREEQKDLLLQYSAQYSYDCLVRLL